MRVTRVLTSEHLLIRRAAACLKRVADDALATHELHVLTAIELLEFFEQFVDAAHQEKEERCLFPALLECGMAPRRVRELTDDHARERATLAATRSNVEGAACGDPTSLEVFAYAALDYAKMEIEHADEEERSLMPVVKEILWPGAERRVLEGFREVDAEVLPKPRRYYFALVHEIAARLGSSYSFHVLCAAAALRGDSVERTKRAPRTARPARTGRRRGETASHARRRRAKTLRRGRRQTHWVS